jgi:delta 1-pyrroline-5-carboxylate dehydrogenase
MRRGPMRTKETDLQEFQLYIGGRSLPAEYGLAAGIWTKDVHRAHRVASGLRAGTVWVNAYRAAGPGVPFGGFNDSGIGRENGVEGLDEFLQTKSVWVELTGGTRDPFVMGLAKAAPAPAAEPER